MSLIRLKNNTWQIRFQFEGKKFQKSTGTKNRAKALEIERKWRQDLLDQKHLGNPEQISLYDALDMFADSKIEMKTHKDILSKIRTVKVYFDNIPLHELSTKCVELFALKRKREGKAAQTIEHNIIQLRGAWLYAQKMGYQVSSIIFPKLKIRNQRIRSLTKEEEVNLLSELEPRNPKYYSKLTPSTERLQLLNQRVDNYDLVLLLMLLGARYSEIAQLKWEQVDLSLQTINLIRTKTDNSVTVLMMSNRVYQVLKRRFDDKVNTTWVFTDKTGKNPRKHSTISIRRAIKNCGLVDFRVHDLRHHAATKLIRNGMSLQEVKYILGHKNIAITERYAHLENAQVANKMKLLLDGYDEENSIAS
jgi:integrase